MNTKNYKIYASERDTAGALPCYLCHKFFEGHENGTFARMEVYKDYRAHTFIFHINCFRAVAGNHFVVEDK
jgi:hypothetical protein